MLPTEHQPLEAQLAALRQENQQLRARLTGAQAQQTESEADGLRQVRFRTVFENSPFGQKIITPDLLIRQANAAVVQMLGCASVEDIVGQEIMKFAHPDHQHDWRYLQQQLCSHKVPSFTLETLLVRADGTSFWCQVTSIRFPNAEEELGYTLLEDISERKELELSLKSLYDAQETILHLVAHDLKTPLVHIQLAADLLQRQLDNEDSAPDRAQYLALIRRACADGMKLLQDVLFLGSLDAARLQKQPTDLGALLTQQLAGHHLVAHDKGLALVLDLPAQPLRANVHAAFFRRVVDNLVSNALKFTPAGGRITVSSRETPTGVLLTVRDTGVGIPEALQASLFEKFSTSARTGVGGEASTGLGLFITKKIVQLHRGKVWVESQPGEGTCFFVELT